ncbi:MAG TPA: hypothetical protein VFO89_03210 [Thermoanaerobaculia bacterium]|nr:hypothetical protein [Thermoanaerobaculia bacterium]
MPETAAVAYVVVAPEPLRARVTRLAEERAALDPERRLVVKPGDATYPEAARVARWCGGAQVAAIVFDMRGRIFERLSPDRALVAAWVDDAFLRGRR